MHGLYDSTVQSVIRHCTSSNDEVVDLFHQTTKSSKIGNILAKNIESKTKVNNVPRTLFMNENKYTH